MSAGKLLSFPAGPLCRLTLRRAGRRRPGHRPSKVVMIPPCASRNRERQKTVIRPSADFDFRTTRERERSDLGDHLVASGAVGTQWRLACAGWCCDLRIWQADESDDGWPVVARAVVVCCLDAVGADCPAFDGARVGAVGAAGVEVPCPGHLGQGAGEEPVSLLRGERPGRRPGGRRGRLW